MSQTSAPPEDATLPKAPLRISSQPPIGGKLGPEQEHFVVDELPLYEPSGSGEHWYVRLQKRNLTTPEMIRHIAKLAGVRERDIGYAGLKDKHALTRQWISLPSHATPPETWELPTGIECLAVSRHNNKLRTGHLKGNHFEVTLVELAKTGHKHAQAIVKELSQSGLPNYFGEQRFGHGGNNLAQAVRWLNEPPRGHRKKARFYDKLYPSVLQAEAFNRYVTSRFLHGLDQLLMGEVVRLNGSQSVFVVDDTAAEQARLESGDIVLTGPMFGPRAVTAKDDAAELESEAVASLGLSSEQLLRLGKFAKGTRRDLVIPLAGLTLTQLDASSLRLEFQLPAGSYATQVIRELTGSAWLAVRDANASQSD